MITPWDHQVTIAKQAVDIIKEYMIVYLAMEERTGKSLTSLLIAEQLQVKDVLIITKKKALGDWVQLLKDADLKHNYKVVNYHQAWKLNGEYDLILLDESHNYLSSYPKIGATSAQLTELRKQGKPNKSIYDAIKRLCRQKPIIYISATPYAQGPQLLFHQLALSSWSPWKAYSNFYNWFRAYGRPYTVKLQGREVTQYDRCNTNMVVGMSEHLFITETREALGFEHEPEDVLHHIELSRETKMIYNELLEDQMTFLVGSADPLVCDTVMKLRTSLHMLEGGVAKIEKQYLCLDNQEKIDYIKEHFHDSLDLVIMYNYIAEKAKLEDSFVNARILQATSYAEGVDLSMHKNLVIYSQDFSTARHTQRRARQCNLKRDKPINVHYLLVKKAISEQVYKTVSLNKKNFVDSVFEREEL